MVSNRMLSSKVRYLCICAAACTGEEGGRREGGRKKGGREGGRGKGGRGGGVGGVEGRREGGREGWKRREGRRGNEWEKMIQVICDEFML